MEQGCRSSSTATLAVAGTAPSGSQPFRSTPILPQPISNKEYKMMSFSRVMTLVLAILVVPAVAVDYEAPTKVDNQNRTGDLPFSTSVGTDIEHIDVGSGSLIVTIPIVSLPGRQMPFNFALRWEGMFW